MKPKLKLKPKPKPNPKLKPNMKLKPNLIPNLKPKPKPNLKQKQKEELGLRLYLPQTLIFEFLKTCQKNKKKVQNGSVNKAE